MYHFQKVSIILGLFVILSNGFPDGAPPDTCVKDRVNQPYHGKYRTQDLATIPYQVVASAGRYKPDETIQVTIEGVRDVFRGFFLQARDPVTNEWVGEFVESQNTNTIPECASITHADNRDKNRATFVWKAPSFRQGQVYFT
jgi:hypothetical protein